MIPFIMASSKCLLNIIITITIGGGEKYTIDINNSISFLH